ncbi:addiction module protein [Glaciecola sp. MH2013]|uniref:addiction module protein n=1 Tax=Glaciecola sp. MH2013 TaxID=2785524 RepID=UPI001E34F4E1|nr:addiction module protein [Glaciecola sp. MH2013]
MSVSERIILAEALWDSVSNQHDEIQLSAEQKSELDRRLTAFHLDKDHGETWEQVKTDILSK